MTHLPPGAFLGVGFIIAVLVAFIVSVIRRPATPSRPVSSVTVASLKRRPRILVTCKNCFGAGEVQLGLVGPESTIKCPVCHGEGEVAA